MKNIQYYFKLLLIFAVIGLCNINDVNAQWEDEDWDIGEWIENNWDNLEEGTYYFGEDSDVYYTDDNDNTFYVNDDGSYSYCPSCETGGYDGYGVDMSDNNDYYTGYDDFIDYTYEPVDEDDPIMGYDEDEGMVYFWDDEIDDWVTEDPTVEELPEPLSTIAINGVTFFGYSSTDAKGCYRRCQDMMESKGYTCAGSDDVRNKQMTKYDSNGNLVTIDCEGGKELINNTLESGKPVVVGTDYKEGHTGNVDETTDHWVIITGRGNDSKGNYYEYYDPQTSQETIGTSENNKLYEQDDGTIKGDYRTGSQYERTYTVTLVRATDN